MTNAELIFKIKAEIERLKELHKTPTFKGDEYEEGGVNGYQLALDKLLSFISTLESEKPINPDAAMKELDEKIALVKQRGTWDGVDVDKYMDEVRGREPEKPVPKDLEEAANKYATEWHENPDGSAWKPYFEVSAIKAFIAGAKWQKEQDEEEQADLFTIVALDAAQRAKEQMMKEAVEGKIIFLLNGDVAVNIGDTDKYNLGQKIRVIVLPKED